jgi:hypothetical protein
MRQREREEDSFMNPEEGKTLRVTAERGCIQLRIEFWRNGTAEAFTLSRVTSRRFLEVLRLWVEKEESR